MNFRVVYVSDVKAVPVPPRCLVYQMGGGSGDVLAMPNAVLDEAFQGLSVVRRFNVRDRFGNGVSLNVESQGRGPLGEAAMSGKCESLCKGLEQRLLDSTREA